MILKTPWGTTANRENEEDVMPNEAHVHHRKKVDERTEEMDDSKSVSTLCGTNFFSNRHCCQ